MSPCFKLGQHDALGSQLHPAPGCSHCPQGAGVPTAVFQQHGYAIPSLVTAPAPPQQTAEGLRGFMDLAQVTRTQRLVTTLQSEIVGDKKKQLCHPKSLKTVEI